MQVQAGGDWRDGSGPAAPGEGNQNSISRMVDYQLLNICEDQPIAPCEGNLKKSFHFWPVIS